MQKGLGISRPKNAFLLKYRRWVGKLESFVWRFKRDVAVVNRVQVFHEERLQQCRREKRGLILVSVHHYYMGLFFYWANQVVPKLEPYLVANFWLQRRPRLHTFLYRGHQRLFNGRLIHIGQDMRKAVRILQDKGTLILLQDHLQKDAPLVEFLGHRVPNPLGAARLAEMTDSLILPFIAKNEIHSKKKWSIHFQAPIDPRERMTKQKLLLK